MCYTYANKHIRWYAVARRTIDGQIALLEDERTRLEVKVSEQEAFKEITASGDYGSSTAFTDLSKLHARLATIYNQLETLYRQQGV